MEKIRYATYRCTFCKYKTHTVEIMWEHFKKNHKYQCMIQETEEMNL